MKGKIVHYPQNFNSEFSVEQRQEGLDMQMKEEK